MQKKYKLIEEYPGSPKLGTVIDEWSPSKNEKFYSFQNGTTRVQVVIDNPKNYPKLWEEIVEKDYEILSIWDRGSEFPKMPNGDFGITGCSISKKLIDNYPIHSVKRLSDGEVFTVGDKVIDNLNMIFNITGFGLSDNYKSGLSISDGKGGRCFNLISKCKSPLFITEDGVDIFYGDKFYFVSEKFNKFKCPVENYASENHWRDANMKTFSTKIAAEEYILMNKPCLSVNDLKSISPNFGAHSTVIVYSRLKELAKSKI